ncbi:MAG: hypothetical protein GX333_02325 [Syntrophomonadaceae bacterium]|nr:hypothetical protein [Syntrophomonadaceae bacterium]
MSKIKANKLANKDLKLIKRANKASSITSKPHNLISRPENKLNHRANYETASCNR